MLPKCTTKARKKSCQILLKKLHKSYQNLLKIVTKKLKKLHKSYQKTFKNKHKNFEKVAKKVTRQKKLIKKIRNIIDIIIGSGKTLQIHVKSINQINFTPKHEYFKYK